MLKERTPKALVAVLILSAVFILVASAVAAVQPPEWLRATYVESKNLVGLAWKPVPGASKYQVLRSTTAGQGHEVIATIPTPMFMDKKVEAGTTYFYALKAVKGNEASLLSKEKSVIIPGIKKVEVTAPKWSVAKSDVRVEMGQKKASVSLVWQKPEAANIITFNLYRKGPGDDDYQMIASVIDTKYSDEAVEIGKAYSYTLTSVDDSFTETDMSEPKEIKIADVTIAKRRKVKLEVVPRPTKVLYRRLKGTPAPGSVGELEIEEPFDSVVDEEHGLVYFSSTNTQKIVVFNLEGEFVRYIGLEGKATEDGVLVYPLGMGIDSRGYIYVADGKRNDVQIFDWEGKFVRKVIPVKDEELPNPPQPKDVAVAKNGTTYILDSPNGQVQVFSSNGEFKFKISEFGTEPGTLRNPNYMTLSNDGEKVVVANTGMAMVSVFSKDGKFLGQWGGKKNDVGKFVFIAAVTTDKEDRVYVSDLNTGFVQVFNLDGQYLFSLADETGEQTVDLFAPRGIFIDPKDRIYVTEGMIGRVSVLQLLDLPEYEPQGAPFEE